MSSLSNRIKYLIDLKDLNISKFEKAIGVANNTIGTFLRRDASLSSDILVKILNTFPDVNSDWLLIGKGEILHSEARDNATPREITSLIDELLKMSDKAEMTQKLASLREIAAQLDMSHAMLQIQIKKLETQNEELGNLVKNTLLFKPKE